MKKEKAIQSQKTTFLGKGWENSTCASSWQNEKKKMKKRKERTRT
jgi:hypothetical protein